MGGVKWCYLSIFVQILGLKYVCFFMNVNRILNYIFKSN